MKKFKNDNGKKIIIGMSVLFCTIILIIGGASAYFTQSDTKPIENIVTTNINGSIGYTNKNNYMKGNLIPVMEDDVIKFASKNSKNTENTYTNDEICLYKDDMYACNLYEFTITNNANVTQEMKVTLNPSPNEFTNLHYILVEEKQEEISLNSIKAKEKTLIEGNNSSVMVNSVVLAPNQSKTYTAIFYIKNLENTNQTEDDANKRFGAIIRVDSITTGTYKVAPIGQTCYEFETITEGEYKDTIRLTKFKGIDDNGEPKTSCGVEKENNFYKVTVPSELEGGLKISTLGNSVFQGIDTTNFSSTSNAYISDIVIKDGIEIIEDGYSNQQGLAGTFAYMGVDLWSENPWFENYQFNIELPNTLKYLGAYSFEGNQIYTLNIPASVETISNNVMGDTMTQKFLTNLTFEGANDGKRSLISIGNEAFNNVYIENLIIPASVKEIGNKAFGGNDNLSKITFMGADTNDSSLETIGEEAFHNARLNYVNEPLVLPSTLTSIGDNAFEGGIDRIGNFQKVLFMGTRTDLNKLGTNWYASGYTTVTPYVEE